MRSFCKYGKENRIIRGEVAGFHDPPRPPPAIIKDEYAPASIITAYFRSCCMDRAVAFLFLWDEPEEGACFRAACKGARLKILIQKEGGFVGINHHRRPLAGITVQNNIP